MLLRSPWKQIYDIKLFTFEAKINVVNNAYTLCLPWKQTYDIISKYYHDFFGKDVKCISQKFVNVKTS